MFELAVTLRGKSVSDLLAQAQALIDAEGKVAGKTGKTGKTGKKAAEADDDDSLSALGGDDVGGDETDTASDEGLDFMNASDDGEEETAPPAKAGKTKKITDKDVNEAAIKYGKKHGRKATFALLKKKFNIESIMELDESKYAAAIKALAV